MCIDYQKTLDWLIGRSDKEKIINELQSLLGGMKSLDKHNWVNIHGKVEALLKELGDNPINVEDVKMRMICW